MAFAAVLVVTAGAVLRGGRAACRAPRIGVGTLVQVLAVAWVYDLARAVSLLVRAPHRNAAQTVEAQ
jgi:hypothetical protein